MQAAPDRASVESQSLGHAKVIGNLCQGFEPDKAVE